MFEKSLWLEFKDIELEGNFFIPIQSFSGIGYDEDNILIWVTGKEVIIFENPKNELSIISMREITINLAKEIKRFSKSEQGTVIDLSHMASIMANNKLLEQRQSDNLSQEDNTNV